MRKLIIACMAFAVTACASVDTPRQRAYDLATKFEAVQLVAEEVVTDENIPADVRRKVQTMEGVAYEAVEAYVTAVKNGEPNTQSYLTEGLKAVMDLTQYLIQRGYFTENEAASLFPSYEKEAA